MEEEAGQRPGLIARITADPIGLRRWSWVALLVLALLTFIAQLLDSSLGAMLTALTWICVPIVALGIGVGDAFFVRHGRSMRRLILSIIASVFATLTSCVILASISDSSSSLTRNGVIGLLYALLYVGIVTGLAALIALGIGRGEDYVSQRIDRMSREDW